MTAGDGFLVRAGATGLTATISVSNAAGGRSGLEIGAVAEHRQRLAERGPAVPYLVSAGSYRVLGHVQRRRHGRHVQ